MRGCTSENFIEDICIIMTTIVHGKHAMTFTFIYFSCLSPHPNLMGRDDLPGDHSRSMQSHRLQHTPGPGHVTSHDDNLTSHDADVPPYWHSWPESLCKWFFVWQKSEGNWFKFFSSLTYSAIKNQCLIHHFVAPYKDLGSSGCAPDTRTQPDDVIMM